MIVEEGDPMGGFHSFVAGIKKRCRIKDIEDKSASEVAKPKKIRRVNGLEEFLDIYKGDHLFSLSLVYSNTNLLCYLLVSFFL
jgi:hypothetical protein